MPSIDAETLTRFIRDLFVAHGVTDRKAEIVARSLVLSNLKGHDSHGVIRALNYLDWMTKGWIVPDAELELIRETDTLLVMDGHFGFGQVVVREATARAIEKAKQSGACILSLRRSAHLGRIGEWAEMAAEEGLICFSFTNTHGGGVLVAPHGGRERRLSANPLGAAAPLPDGGMLVMDIATSVVAEGKLGVARARGQSVPEGWFVNAEGEPSTDPAEFYADPPGALLPFGGHKGYALGLFTDILAGALTGAGCSKKATIVANAMLAVFLDPKAFAGESFVLEETGNLAHYVKESAPIPGVEEILLPGEPEDRSFHRRREQGIPIEEATWNRLSEVARESGVVVPVG